MIYAYRFTTTFSDFKVLRLLIHYIRLTITFLFVEPRFRYPFFSPLPRDSQAWESLVGSPVAGALGGLSPQMYDMPVIRKKTCWIHQQVKINQINLNIFLVLLEQHRFSSLNFSLILIFLIKSFYEFICNMFNTFITFSCNFSRKCTTYTNCTSSCISPFFYIRCRNTPRRH